MKVNYKEIKYLIGGKLPFKGNSCKGYIDNEGVYRIISYATEVYNSKEGLNLTYYSVTTSKLQGIIGEAIYGKSLKELRKEEEKETKVIQALKDNNIESEYCSPNTVNLYANKIGIELTSQQVVKISDNYK